MKTFVENVLLTNVFKTTPGRFQPSQHTNKQTNKQTNTSNSVQYKKEVKSICCSSMASVVISSISLFVILIFEVRIFERLTDRTFDEWNDVPPESFLVLSAIIRIHSKTYTLVRSNNSPQPRKD
jgi:hypothetical protein